MRPFAPITDIDVALNISIILLITIMLFCCVILIISYFEVFRLSIIDKWFFTFIPIFASSMFMIILDWYIAFPLSFLYTYIMYIGAKNYLEKDQIIELEGANSRFRKRRSKQTELFSNLSTQEQQKHREFIQNHPVSLNSKVYFSFWLSVTMLIFVLLNISGIPYRL